MNRKKITKTLRRLSHSKSKSNPVVKGILMGTALIVSGYGIVNAEKAVKAFAADAKKNANVIILGHTGSGTNPHFEECYRCTCHGVPVPDTKASEEKKNIEANTAAMDSLDPDDRAFMEGLIDFLRESELIDELDESVTTASLIGYMKENDIFDEIHHICKKKDIACDDIEGIIHAIFKAGKFGKHMDAEQKLSVILDDCSSDYFDSDNAENIAQFTSCDV